MRVLVTGGAGFIGSHLTDAFLARGDEVAIVDDLSRGRYGRLDDRATAHKLSITDAAPLTALVEQTRPELICHLAAQIDIRVSVAAPAEDAQANVVGTVNVLEAARAADARVLFCSIGGALIGEAVGRAVDPQFAPARPGELQRSALAAEQAERDLGWKPAVCVADGVRRVYRWIEAGAPDRAAY